MITMAGPRAWRTLDRGFRLGVLDGSGIVATYPVAALWHDPDVQTTWSALVSIGEFLVEMSSDDYALGTETPDGRSRWCWIIQPGDPPVPDGFLTPEEV